MNQSYIFDFVAIIAAACRDYPEEEAFRRWLRGSTAPAANRALRRLSQLYHCGPRLNALLIRAGQDHGNACQIPRLTSPFLRDSYMLWEEEKRQQDLGSLHARRDAQTIESLLTPLLPEQQFKQLAERFPSVTSVIELCDRHEIEHKVSAHTVFDLVDGLNGVDLWTHLYSMSMDGFKVRYQDLVDAADNESALSA